jgi:hypothetical protein
MLCNSFLLWMYIQYIYKLYICFVDFKTQTGTINSSQKKLGILKGRRQYPHETSIPWKRTSWVEWSRFKKFEPRLDHPVSSSASTEKSTKFLYQFRVYKEKAPRKQSPSQFVRRSHKEVLRKVWTYPVKEKKKDSLSRCREYPRCQSQIHGISLVTCAKSNRIGGCLVSNLELLWT